MPSPEKPTGILSYFNKASKALVSAGALALVLMSAAPGDAYAQDTAPDPAATQSQSINYEYDGDRTIRLTGSVNKKTAIMVIKKLYELSEADPTADIELRISSGGGSVTDGMAIYDVMKSLPNDIITVCEGEAQSMAAFLLSAGTQGKRFSYPNCEIMYHQPSWGRSGQITDMEVITGQGNVSKDRMIKIIAEDSGWSEKVIRDLLERNFYPTAEEAKEMGFIDHIIEEKNPDAAPTPKTKLPDNFCENPSRNHMNICQP